MKNPLELIQFGREISDNYVRDNVPLTQSLEKIAQTHNLNKQEMHRVAETANVETYLKMIEKSNDKYVEFPVADASKVYDSISTKTAAIHENIPIADYADINPKGLEFSFSLYSKGNEIEKVAEEVIDIASLVNQADSINGTLAYLENSYMDTTVSLANKYDKIYEFTKQAMLGEGVLFSEVKELIKIASSANAEELVESLEHDLKKIMPIYDFEKTASIEGKPNKNSEIYQAVLNYDNELSYLSKIAAMYEQYEKAFDSLNEDNRLGISKKATVLSKLKTGLAVAAGTGLVAGGAGFGAGLKITKNQLKAGKVLNQATAQEAMMQARNIARN